MRTIKGYKTIQDDMKSKEGDHTWELGKWYKSDGAITICDKGFHACRKPYQVLEYIYGDKLFQVEARGEIIYDNDKFVASEMRLVKEIDLKKVSVKYAIFCAKNCLKNFEKVYPSDKIPREAIKAAEGYMAGKIKLNVLYTAGSAASAWSAELASRSETGSAAWAATRSARSAVWSAERAALSAALSARSAAQSAQCKYFDKIIKEALKC